jgi:DNA-binding NarL/FixJ family response regulator
MDVNMPRMNGIEATRQIKQTLPSIVVVGLSVRDAAADAMMEAGAAAYLDKSAASDDLCRAMYEAWMTRATQDT